MAVGGELDSCTTVKLKGMRMSAIAEGHARLANSAESSAVREATSRYSVQCFVTTVPLLLMDALVAFGCFCLATLVLPGGLHMWAWLLPFSVSIVMASLAVGLHRVVGVHPIFEFRQMSVTVLFSLCFMASSNWLFGLPYSWVSLVLVHTLMLICLPPMRGLTRSMLATTSWWGVRSIVLGCDRRVNRLFSDHLSSVANGLRPIGFVESKLEANCSPEVRSWYLGTPAACLARRKSHHVSCAIVHRHGRPDHELVEYVQKHLAGFRRVYFYSDGMRLPTLWSGEGSFGVRYEDKLLRPESRFIKRTLDLTVAMGVLFVGSPVLGILALWTKLSSPGPVFFGHERIGKNGQRFKVWKFRSMVTNGDEVLKQHLADNPEAQAEWDATFKLQNDPRITTVGHLLRKTSLDELPQLWNVVVGDMSLVGPRPIVAAEIERYADIYTTYLQVQPGITGFWQVSGRNLTTYERRVELDHYYVRNWSVFFDLYVLGRTIKTVLFREGAF